MRTPVRVALAAAVIALALTAPARAQTTTCTTLDLSGRAASSFRPGAELALKGQGYPPNELVLVTFRQPAGTVELARYKTDAHGAFTSQPRILRVPADASSGRAGIHIASSRGSATCDVQIVGAASAPSATPRTSRDQQVEPWIVAWATLLALGAAGLGYVRYRRWRQSQLERQMARPGGHRRLGG